MRQNHPADLLFPLLGLLRELAEAPLTPDIFAVAGLLRQPTREMCPLFEGAQGRIEGTIQHIALVYKQTPGGIGVTNLAAKAQEIAIVKLGEGTTTAKTELRLWREIFWSPGFSR
jgi:hypothetical protein